MTMKLKGRKASLYATAMAISLVALSGTAHAQSASNGKFKASLLPAAEAAGGVKTTTTNKAATLTAAQIAAAKETAEKKLDLATRNDITAKLLSSINAASKSAFDAAKVADADNTAKIASKDLTAALLDGSAGVAVPTVGGVAPNSAAGSKLVGTTYVTTDAAKDGTFVYGSSGAKYVATATAMKAAAEAAASALLTVRTAANAELTAASAALPSLQTALDSAIAAATVNNPNTAAINTARANLAAANRRVELASVAQAQANTNYTAALAASDARNTAFQTATNSKIAAENAQVQSSSAKSFADQAVASALTADTGYVAALAAVQGAAPAALVAGTNITQAQADYYARYGLTLTAGVAATSTNVTDAAATLAGVTNAAVAALTTNFSSLAAIEKLDDQTVTTTTNYASNGFTSTTASLASAAASSNASIAMASAALTGADAALEVNAQFEIEVLDALVDHETRITAVEGVVASVATNTAAIATEATERKAADAVLTTAIATEVTERKAADAALDTRVTATANGLTKEVADRIAADTANNNARIAEDTRLAGLITAESNARVAMGQELRDRISSSTATAIALGGAALLPDMGFTLSGNVAFYEGAQAIALNAAAKVGPNAYVTAAAGGGLNKRGSVGGRVGFVIGF